MANVKTTLDTRRVKSDGTYNIIYRITHYKKVYTINSSISVYEVFWNSSSRRIATKHPNSKLLNLKLSKGYYKIEQALLMLEDDFAIDKLKRMLNGHAKDDFDTFQVFASKLIQQMINVEVYTLGDLFITDTSTDASGNFLIQGLEGGNYKLKISLTDYQTYESELIEVTVGDVIDAGIIEMMPSE
jgi:hypothetical protein